MRQMKLSLEQHALKRRIDKFIRATPTFTPDAAMKSWNVDEGFFSAFMTEVARRRRDTVHFQDGAWHVHNHTVSSWLIARVIEVLQCPKPVRKKRKKPQLKCAFPDCPTPPRHSHHILYRPPLTAPLCFGHHIEVTVCNINTVESIEAELGWRRKLRNPERREIWECWRSGFLQPEFTPNAMRWVGKWKTPKGAWDPRPSSEESPSVPGFAPNAFR